MLHNGEAKLYIVGGNVGAYSEIDLFDSVQLQNPEVSFFSTNQDAWPGWFAHCLGGQSPNEEAKEVPRTGHSRKQNVRFRIQLGCVF